MGEWITGLVDGAGYGTIFLLMLLETIFPPIPSELIMTLAGTRTTGPDALSLPLAIAAGTAGAMLGNTAWYVLARRLGLDRFRPFVRRFGRVLTLDWRGVERADRFFDRFAGVFVCLGRMTPTLRSLVSIPAGLFGMPLVPFLVWSTLGTAGWTAGLAVAGHLLGARAGAVDRWLGPISFAVIGLMVAIYLYRVVTWRRDH